MEAFTMDVLQVGVASGAGWGRGRRRRRRIEKHIAAAICRCMILPRQVRSTVPSCARTFLVDPTVRRAVRRARIFTETSCDTDGWIYCHHNKFAPNTRRKVRILIFTRNKHTLGLTQQVGCQHILAKLDPTLPITSGYLELRRR
ncbi:unnamed protein product [Prorocentrum cordatum]|uniref:Uncharacterized protein n=1 Tax=Prorocentrum cordatum TaxID=2364126 RepID=A0ABN9S2S1_9DINO|nr:unnamed protein product [Polarella glacialis]